MSATEHIAEIICGFRASDVPEAVLTQAGHCLVDSVACALAARETEIGLKLLAAARRQAGAPEATLLGETTLIGAAPAAWANSSLSNLLDMDDTFAGFAHIGNAVIPTALAVGELVGASGRDVLTAIVVGFEVAARIGLAIWPSPEREKLYGIQPTWKVFGAVTAASKLLELNQNEIVQAFGLAGTCAPLPMTRLKGDQFPRGWYKNGHGWGAFTGIFWTLLARDGVPGANTILDGEGGFWRLAGSDRCAWDRLTEGFGQRWHILDVEFKPYPACRWAHSTLDGFGAILAETGLRPDEVESVHVACFKGSELSNRSPREMMDAPFSIPHLLAMVALGKPASVDWMLDESLFDPAVRRFAEKVTVETDAEAEDLFARSHGQILLGKVRVTASDGAVLERRVDFPRGTPGVNPLTEADLMAKFETLASRALDGPARRHAVEQLLGVERLGRIGELTQALGVAGRPERREALA